VARTTLLATGGYAALWAQTTNLAEATGDGLLLADAAGARLADLEFVQFHPTALAGGFLLSESLRGAGAILIDQDGRRFIDELAPRDIVARAIAERAAVRLDLRPVARDRYPTLIRRLREAGYEPDWEPISAAHYTIGGIATDLDGRTSVADSMPPANAPARASTAPTGSHQTRCLSAWSSAPAQRSQRSTNRSGRARIPWQLWPRATTTIRPERSRRSGRTPALRATPPDSSASRGPTASSPDWWPPSHLPAQKAAASTSAPTYVFQRLDPSLRVIARRQDGTTLRQTPVTVAEVRGHARAILTGERTALNLLSRLSGIATLTRRYVDAVADTGVAIRDTRKTTPGLCSWKSTPSAAAAATTPLQPARPSPDQGEPPANRRWDQSRDGRSRNDQLRDADSG
jgi:hypothetical protein